MSLYFPMSLHALSIYLEYNDDIIINLCSWEPGKDNRMYLVTSTWVNKPDDRETTLSRTYATM